MNLNLTDEEAFRILSEGKYNIIPIYCEVLADLESPMSAYMKLSLDAKSSTFLLESVEGGLHQARYSFIGIDPDDVLVQNGIDPLIEIERRMKGLSSYPVPDLPSFSGGTMGYISYDCIQYFEPTVKINNISTLEVPESVYMFFSTLVVFDHLRHSIKIVSNIDFTRRDFVTKSYQQCGISCDDDVSITQECVSKLYTLACERIQSILKKLSQPLSSSTAPSLPVFIDLHFERRTLIDESIPCGCKDKKDNGNGNGNDNVKNEKCECYTLVSNQGAEGYKGFVTSLKENIVKGDIIQAVPSHRLSRRVANNTTSIDIYRKLRLVNPSPYMFHINFIDNDVGNEKGFQIIGASPEQLVKVDEKRRVTTHPIAGTRRRGRTPEEDYALEKELLSNEKERAEHIMLVDLGRNDLGKISKTGSVKIDSFMHVERYSHVMHIVSHVSGQLKDTISTCDALRSVFPAGTVSGAPKVRAMQLVAELEQCKRDIYAGCVGYFSNTGVLDTAIAIRTMVMKDTMIHLQAGGGIVHDSSIQDEYDETINKMKGAEVAVIRAENANYYYHKQRKVESEKKE